VKRFLVFAMLAGFSAWGCAGRRAAANRHPPQPPAEAEPSATEEKPAPLPSAPRRKPPARSEAGGYAEEGLASWYGVPFHGRRAANGETYNMHKLTAAHRTLPFDSIVRVTNLTNGRSVDVRITDRGPFVENRIIDLSLNAAQALDLVAMGVAPVRIELLSGSNPAAGYFTVQVGAFLDQRNAERLRERLAQTYSPAFIQEYDSPSGYFYRVRVGKVSGEDAARQFGEQLRAREGFVPFVVRMDESDAPGGDR